MPAPATRPHQDTVTADVAAVTLIVGEEELLVERAIAATRAAVTATTASSGPDAGPDVHDVAASDLAHGELSMLTSPSLFGGLCVVIVRGAQDASQSSPPSTRSSWRRGCRRTSAW
jgi:DNA polymerase III delta subunit